MATALNAAVRSYLGALTVKLFRVDLPFRTSPSFVSAVLVPAGLTLLLVAFATTVVFAFSGFLPTLNLVSIIYLIPVLTAALWWGVWPATLAAISGALAADFFFYPPIYSFWISDSQNIADLIVFLIVALVSGNLTANLRQREREIHDLYGYSKRLAACFTTTDMIRATQEYLSAAIGYPAFLIEGQDVEEESSKSIGPPQDVRRAAAAMVLRNELASQTNYDDATGHAWLVRRVALGAAAYFVFVDLGAGRLGAQPTLNGRVDAILTEAAENLDRLDLAKAIEEAKIQAQADALKSALVATMSHELRSPLVSIIGAASVLEQMTEIMQDARARSLVGTVHNEAARLDSDIQNLISAARITTGAAPSNPTLTDPVDMVHAAVAQKGTQLAAHHLEVSLAPELPLVEVQSALVENALGQLLDNAAKYSPPGSTIKVEGRVDRSWVAISVSDQGAGLTPDERQRAGQQSFRGERHAGAIPGSGLGLWIASTLIAATGGRLDVDSAGPGLGTTVRIRLPAARDVSGG